MKRGYKILLFVLFIGIAISHTSFGQNCVQILKRAQISYDEGRISEVPYLLESCLKNGFNKEEAATAYRLLTLTYLYLDEPQKADESILKLLRLNPDYRVNTAIDPTEFINLYNKYRTRPILKFGVKGGINWMFFNVTKDNDTNGNSDDRVKMQSQAGFQIGFTSEFDLSSRVEFSPELLYAIKEFKFQFSHNYQVNTYNERLNILSLPLIFKYNLRKDKDLRPYIITGFEPSFLLSATANTTGALNSPSLNVTYERTRFSYAAIVGVGLKNKVGPGIASIGARFVYGLNDQVNEVYHNNGTRPLTYGAVISRYTLNTFNLNVGYIIPIYKPKKIK